MEWDLYLKIIDEMARIGFEHNFRPQMTYCYMGEPFLADDLDRYVRCALDHGIDVYLNTNAAAMTPPKIDALLATGFTGRIHISVHGITPKVYQRIMGLDYEKSRANIDYLLDRYVPDRICIRGVDDGWPNGEKQRWLTYWRQRHVQIEYLRPISRCGGVSRLLNRPLRDGARTRLYGCQEHHPLVEMVILFDGRAVMCCQDMGRELIWGDVADRGILDVWNGPVRTAAIARLYSGRPSGNGFLCARCEQAMGMGQMIQSSIQQGWRKLKSKAHHRSAATL